jgi:serine phosphatase RsbU (regulator of sigma subunit)
MTYNANREQQLYLEASLAEVKHKSDAVMNYILAGLFLVGLLLAFYYDTWAIATGVGGLSLIAYYSAKEMLPRSDLYQYVLSTVLGIFMGQYIYQMHGMFEMHFFAFIGSAILITYQQWKLQIPLALVVVIHHGLFGYLQYIGYGEIYFTQLDYMTLETFIIHGILATIVFFICGLWAYNLKKAHISQVSQSYELKQKNQNIVDSIHYAKRIQTAMLPLHSHLEDMFPQSFIFSRPKDIVSGDFFWCYQTVTKKFVAVADCTGHGVPGALMSLVCNNLLNEIVIRDQIEDPGEILELLDIMLSKTITNARGEVNDGMDISIFAVGNYSNEIQYAGAYRPLFYVNGNKEMVELPGSPFPIGGLRQPNKQFETRRLPLVPGQIHYLTSDGYYSQFGGPDNKKFMKKQFREMITSLQDLPIKKQKEALKEIYYSWKGDNEQTDDVLVLGIQL